MPLYCWMADRDRIDARPLLDGYPFISKPVTTVPHFAGQLPSCLIDRNKLKQVLVNLFTNACHAMPAGGQLLVTTRAHRVRAEDGHPPFKAGDLLVLVEIADNGTGIAPEHLSKIFDPYFTTKETGKGNGLGLTVAKTIIDLHGGRINVTNRSEGGAIATIALPSQREDEKT